MLPFMLLFSYYMYFARFLFFTSSDLNLLPNWMSLSKIHRPFPVKCTLKKIIKKTCCTTSKMDKIPTNREEKLPSSHAVHAFLRDISTSVPAQMQAVGCFDFGGGKVKYN